MTSYNKLVSMTSVLTHTVAQLTKWRRLPKNLSWLVIFVIGLAFTWSWVNKNHQNLIFKVNFLLQISVIRLGEQLIIKPFFDNFIFWSSSFSEIGPYFCRHQVNASPITKITSLLKFLGKNIHLVGCATLCAKSEVMLPDLFDY